MWFPITTPDGTEVFPIRDDGKEGCWACGKDGVSRLIAEDRLIWEQRKNKALGTMVWTPYSREFAPDNPERPYMTIWSDVNTTRQAKAHQKQIFSNQALIDTIKPEELIARILCIATNPDDLVLDSFLGSGTTAAVAHKMGRRWIGIEMGEHAKTHCIPRLEKVIAGEQGGISESVHWQGGGSFTFCELADPVFDTWGNINPKVTFDTLSAYLWQKETRTTTVPQKAPFLGAANGVGIYLLYNGILGDKAPASGNVLTRKLMKSLLADYPYEGPKIIYADAVVGITPRELEAAQITFKQIPYDVRG